MSYISFSTKDTSVRVYRYNFTFSPEPLLSKKLFVFLVLTRTNSAAQESDPWRVASFPSCVSVFSVHRATPQTTNTIKILAGAVTSAARNKVPPPTVPTPCALFSCPPTPGTPITPHAPVTPHPSPNPTPPTSFPNYSPTLPPPAPHPPKSLWNT